MGNNGIPRKTSANLFRAHRQARKKGDKVDLSKVGVTEKKPGAVTLKTLPQREYAERTGGFPWTSSLALRAYIEEHAAPLRKTIAMANGQPIERLDEDGNVVGTVTPSWDDQKKAINDLLPKVAPDLKQAEVTYDDGKGGERQESDDVVNKVVDTLRTLAYARRVPETIPGVARRVEGEE